jgi:hypothetical protein
MPTSRILVATLALSLGCFAQSKPNFSGTWKLNVSKSDFGMLPPPDSRTDVIEQTGDMIKDNVSTVTQQGPMQYTVPLKFDGSESTVKAGPREVKVMAAWDGPVLVVTTKLDYEGNPVTVKSNWTLSEDGASWTQAAHIESPMGEMDQKLVFEKQGAGATTTAAAPPAPAAKVGTMGGTASASARPNFSGTWKLNTQKSDFGPIPGPDSETDVIEHNDPNIKLAVDRSGPQGNQKFDLDMAIDGKEQTHKLGDQEVKTTSQWEGNALVVLTKLMFQDNEILIKSAYTLAPDGKTVNVNSHFSSPMGEADQKLVFDKQ